MKILTSLICVGAVRHGHLSFKFRASALWNGLNIKIKNADNIDVFKQRLMKDLKCDIYNCDKIYLDLPKYYNE